MARVSDMYHLVRREGGTYYYQRRVPDDVQSAVGKTLIKRSLRTKDKREAKRARQALDVKWEIEFDRCRSTPVSAGSPQPLADVSGVTHEDVVAWVGRNVERGVARAEIELAHGSFASQEEKRETIVNIEQTLQILQDVDDPQGDEWVEVERRRLEAALGTPIDHLPLDRTALNELLRRGDIELYRRMLAIATQDRRRAFFDHLFGPTRPKSVTFAKLAAQFLDISEEDARANDVSRKRVDQLTAYVRLIEEIVGPKTSVSAIDHDLCLKVRSTLAKVPTNRTKIYREMPLTEAIERAAVEGRSTLSALTQQQYLSAFREMVDLAAKKRLIPLNFAEGLTPVKRDATARRDKRLPFTLGIFCKTWARDADRRDGRLS